MRPCHPIQQNIQYYSPWCSSSFLGVRITGNCVVHLLLQSPRSVCSFCKEMRLLIANPLSFIVPRLGLEAQSWYSSCQCTGLTPPRCPASSLHGNGNTVHVPVTHKSSDTCITLCQRIHTPSSLALCLPSPLVKLNLCFSLRDLDRIFLQ